MTVRVPRSITVSCRDDLRIVRSDAGWRCEWEENGKTVSGPVVVLKKSRTELIEEPEGKRIVLRHDIGDADAQALRDYIAPVLTTANHGLHSEQARMLTHLESLLIRATRPTLRAGDPFTWHEEGRGTFTGIIGVVANDLQGLDLIVEDVKRAGES